MLKHWKAILIGINKAFKDFMTESAAKKQKAQNSDKYLWNSDELEAALGVNVPSGAFVNGICIDSRAVKKGDLFIGLKGERFNGNYFALDALKKGANLCLVDEYPEGYGKFKGQLIKVDDAYQGLVKLGKYARSRVKGKVVGVTGSYGKTTVKELLYYALEGQGKTHITEKNFNTEIGVPLCLARMPRDTDYGVFEMAARGVGQIKELTDIATPDIALITEVGPAHLDMYSSVSAIAGTKSEIFEGVKPEGIAIINNDNTYRQIMLNKAKGLNLKILTFGRERKSNFWILNYEVKRNKAEVMLECMGLDYEYEISVAEPHIAMNTAAVMAVIHALGADMKYAARQFKRFERVEGRGNVIANKAKGWKVINDCYNANPVTMATALDNMDTKGAHKRKVAILGDMAELGHESKRLHSDMCMHIIRNQIDVVFCIGKDMEELYFKLPEEIRGGYYKTSDEFAKIAKGEMKRGDMILIKGSRATAMDSIVDALTK